MYGYEPVEEEMALNILTGFGIIFGIFFIFGIVITVLITVGLWKSLKKAGKGGWEALIPFYNMVILCQISGLSPWWILIVTVGPIVLGFVPVIGGLAAFALCVYFQVIFNISIAKSFGKETGFAFGLLFLPYIFWPLLGGKKTQYVGAKLYDPLFCSLLKENNNLSNQNMNTGMNNNSFNQSMNTGMNNNSFNQNMNTGMNNNSFNQHMNTDMNNNSFNQNMNTDMNNNLFNQNMNTDMNNNLFNQNMNTDMNNNLFNQSMNTDMNNNLSNQSMNTDMNNNLSNQSMTNTVSSFKYCKNCGTKLAIDASFCGQCGSKQE